MGHEVIIYGAIVGPALSGERFRTLQARNKAVINRLPAEDQWPWLTRGNFALPGAWPQGTYRQQIIHFGLTMKDDPPHSEQSAYDPHYGWPREDRVCVY